MRNCVVSPRKAMSSTTPGTPSPSRATAICSGRSDSAARAPSRRRAIGALQPAERRDEPAAVISRDKTLDHIGRADEAGDEAACRALVNLGRRADLLDLAGAHHGDAVGERQRLVLIVGDDDKTGFQPPLNILELELRLLAQLAVERGERLVEQQQRRPRRQRAGERDALPLAAGKLLDSSRAEVLHLHDVEQFADDARLIAARLAPWRRRPKAILSKTFRCGNKA